MSDEEFFEDFPRLPGYISTKEAAGILDVTPQRVAQYARQGRLRGIRAGNNIMVSEEDVKNLERKDPGRPRVSYLPWHIYKDPNTNVLGTDIQVRIRNGQQKNLMKKLKAIKDGGRHIFTGALERYIFEDRDQPDIVNIWLIWKNVDIPDEETHQQELDAFKEELADVLDWDTAKYTYKKGLIYT